MHKNDIEKYVIENRDRFNQEEIPGNHELRFLDKLEKSSVSRIRNMNISLLKIAVSVLMVIAVSGISIYTIMNLKFRPSENIQNTIALAEYRETRDYFIDQVNLGLESIKSLQFSEKDQIDSISNEFKIMDTYCLQLEEELKSNPNDERLMQAIIGLYQVKLDAVTQIVQTVSLSLNHTKNIRHENKI